MIDPKRAASRVMIVEDYTDTRKMYATYLIFRGYDVVEARDGAEALQKAETEPLDVVVMDLALPKIDGWEATRRLKANPATRHIPVIALTGHALAGHEEVAREAGCDAFLAKPCLPDTLVSEIDRVLSHQGSAPVEAAPRRGRMFAKKRR
jgi:CheY-like chemotaxis protein